MRRVRGSSGDDTPGTPAWVVSFSDMVTLLLAFFVLLQVFAKERDPELFKKGQGAFRRAISGFGVADWLYGEEGAREEHPKKKNPTEESTEPPTSRIIDAEEERIRQIFQNLKQQIDTEARDDELGPEQVFLTPIRFERSQESLDASGQAYLKGFLARIKQSAMEGNVTLTVVGLAPDEPAGAQRWMVSSRRARAVENFLRKEFADENRSGNCMLQSWGAGAEASFLAGGGENKKQIFIRILIQRGR